MTISRGTSLFQMNNQGFSTIYILRERAPFLNLRHKYGRSFIRWIDGRGILLVDVHIVVKGDTLWKIARQYGIPFEDLKRVNAHLANPDYIVPGMKIFLPKKKASPPPSEKAHEKVHEKAHEQHHAPQHHAPEHHAPNTMHHNTMRRNTMHHNTMHRNTMHHNTMPQHHAPNTMHRNTMHHNTMSRNTMHRNTMHRRKHMKNQASRSNRFRCRRTKFEMPKPPAVPMQPVQPPTGSDAPPVSMPPPAPMPSIPPPMPMPPMQMPQFFQPIMPVPCGWMPIFDADCVPMPFPSFTQQMPQMPQCAMPQMPTQCKCRCTGNADASSAIGSETA